nr:RNA-directed DNA polymerase, eukaryota, reverse transcriptase zinc-binding domain protein [Tanacetum cinerariifolium]
MGLPDGNLKSKEVLGKKIHYLHSFSFWRDKIPISHIQFADDALIMGDWSLSNARNLSRIITCFHSASGLKVNFHISKIYRIRVTNLEVNSVANTLGCQPSQFPCTYLGLPIGAKMSRCVNWNILVVRFHKRLSKWKSKMGGLGICSLRSSNQALLAKWWWRFLNENDALWCKVIRSIHGHLVTNNTLPLNSKSGTWFHIASLKFDLQSLGINLPIIFKKKIGNGCNTMFWSHNWLASDPLKDLFTHLYRLDINQGCLVCDRSPTFTTQVGLLFRWSWRRPVRSGPEQNDLTDLSSLFSSTPVRSS